MAPSACTHNPRLPCDWESCRSQHQEDSRLVPENMTVVGVILTSHSERCESELALNNTAGIRASESGRHDQERPEADLQAVRLRQLRRFSGGPGQVGSGKIAGEMALDWRGRYTQQRGD